MSRIDEIAAAVVKPLSTTATRTRVVVDAFSLGLATEERYVESAVTLQSVEFAAFAVGGLAAGLTAPADGAVRASALVELPLADSAGGSATASQRVTLYGPGDVRGLDAAQIVRRHPAPGTPNAEETVLAHVEFDRPELPWQFSAAPAASGGTLRPWLALIVVEKAQARWEPAAAMLPILQVPASELPDLDQAAWWAHAQASDATNAPALGVRLSPEFANVNLSRLLSPRVLRQDTDYVAAVVPILDVGVRAGLGLTGGTLGWAWSAGAPDPVRLPVYDSWTFRTGPDGDFRRLALRLDGVVAPYEVGRRFIDVSQPGAPLDPLAPDAPGARQVLRCVLYSPTPPSPEQEPVENARWADAEVARLRQALDRPAQIEGGQPRPDAMPELPIVGPRIYAQAHRGSTGIEGADWFAELNLSPLNRIVAGLGTRVVQRDQEQLMQAAWAQVGEIEKANAAIRQAQFAELVARRLHERLAAVQPGRLLQIAAPLSTRVTLTPGRTLAGEVAASATAPVALGGAFRRALRPGGPVLRRAAAVARSRAAQLVGDGAGLRDFTRVAANPDGVGGLAAAAAGLLDTARAAEALGIGPEAVAPTLATASREMAGGLAGYLSRPAEWGAADATLDWAGRIAEDWQQRLGREPADPTLKAIRDQRVAPLLAELATSKALAASPQRDAFIAQAVKLNNDLVVRMQPRPGGPVTGPVTGPIGPIGPVTGPITGPIGPVIGPVIGPITGPVTGPITGPIVRPPRPGVTGPVRIAPERTRAGHAVARAELPRGRVGRPTASATVRAGRVPTALPGVTAIDPGRLTTIPPGATQKTQMAALADLAKLAPRPVKPVLDRAAAVSADLLRTALPVMVDPAGVLAIAEVPRRAPASAAGLLDALMPTRTVRAALRGRLQLSDAVRERWPIDAVLRPIMAAPRFDRPMYEALAAYDRDWLVPGLGLLPADDFVTVLETNPAFVETFLVGLSDEMGRELLWRGYPTDRRGTCFWRFWDREQDELKQPIHRFSRTPLASHVAIGGDGDGQPRAAIVIKSELVRRFPDLIVDVVRNQGTPDQPAFEKEDSPQQAARELFAAMLEPDIAIVGVDLSVAELARDDWWILVAEHPTAIRFERPDDAAVGSARFLAPGAAAHGAAFAARRLHDPTRVAFRAADLIRRA